MLDKISKKILHELQNDGRISNVELSTRVNLSPAACLERVRKLQEQGFILWLHGAAQSRDAGRGAIGVY